jgi:hypothetical protein
MEKQNLLDRIVENYYDQEILKLEGFDEAVIGIDQNSMRLIYSVRKCIDILMEDMSEEDAIDQFGYETSSAYVGEKTAIFCWDEF